MTPDFMAAATAGLITPDQAAKLADFFRDWRPEGAQPTATGAEPVLQKRGVNLADVLWYAGALIIISAMGMFTTIAFSALGGGALLAIAIGYAIAATLAGANLWNKGLTTPGGLLIAVAVSMAPLAMYGLQDALGWWGTFGDPGAYNGYYDWVKGSWLPMEAATLIAALIAIRFFPFGFIAMIAALALWFMSMDLAPWLSKTGALTWELRRMVSMWFGLIVIIAAWIVDLRQQRADYAFWLHLAGITAFWCGLTFSSSDSEVAKLLYCVLNVGLLGVAVFLGRRIYAVFGTIGIATYLGYVSSKLFMDSILFPFVLSAIGLGVIGLGLAYRRHSARFAAALEQALPPGLLALRPQAAR
ncbi:MAG: hypothetical protein ABWZ80_10755 [Beijerinckiaceae bacterium]